VHFSTEEPETKGIEKKGNERSAHCTIQNLKGSFQKQRRRRRRQRRTSLQEGANLQTAQPQ